MCTPIERDTNVRNMCDARDRGDAVTFQKARETVVREHWRLAVRLANRFAALSPHSAEPEDLAQLGAMGLIRACETFDPARGVTFGSYAGNWIRDSVQQGLAGYSAISLPRRVRAQVVRARALENGSLTKIGRAPTPEEATAVLGAETPRVPTVTGRLSQIPVASAEDSVEETVTREERKALVRAALDSFSPRDRAIVVARYGLDGEDGERPIAAVAAEVGLNAKTVHAVCRRVLGTLKARLSRLTHGPTDR